MFSIRSSRIKDGDSHESRVKDDKSDYSRVHVDEAVHDTGLPVDPDYNQTFDSDMSLVTSPAAVFVSQSPTVEPTLRST